MMAQSQAAAAQIVNGNHQCTKSAQRWAKSEIRCVQGQSHKPTANKPMTINQLSWQEGRWS